jgi:hypothetical protein
MRLAAGHTEADERFGTLIDIFVDGLARRLDQEGSPRAATNAALPQTRQRRSSGA